MLSVFADCSLKPHYEVCQESSVFEGQKLTTFSEGLMDSWRVGGRRVGGGEWVGGEVLSLLLNFRLCNGSIY